jgi:pilus assembly protein Flp/PilA
MRKMINFFRRFADDENGTALMEYSILLGLVVVAVIAIIGALASWIQTQWLTLCNGLVGNCGAGGSPGGGGGGGGPGGA